MNRKKLIIFSLLLIIFLTVNVEAIDSFDEDAWIGSYFLSPKRDIIMEPFIEIRKDNYNIRSPESDIKTIIVDYILVENLTDYDQINLDDFEQSDFKYKKIEQIQKEINLFYKISKEVKIRYRSLNNNLRPNNFYRFFHIQVSKFEEFTLKHLNHELMEEKATYYEKINPKENELTESKRTVEMINKLLPVKAKEIKKYKDSPLVTYYQSEYSESQKDRMRDKVNDAIFVSQEIVNIEEKRFSIKDLKDTYDYFNKYDESVYDYIFTNTEIKIINKNISEILNDLSERR